MSSQQQLAMMDNEGRVPPQQAIYSDLLGVSYPSKKTQIQFTCSNGDSFAPGGKNTMEIPIAVGTGQWVDLSNSYLKFTITSANLATNTDDTGFASPHDFINRIQILGTNSEILEDCQAYNTLARMLYSHQLGDDGLIYNNNLGESAVPRSKATFVATTSTQRDIGIAALAATAASAAIAANEIHGNTAGAGAHNSMGGTTNLPVAQLGDEDGTLTVAFPIISGITSCGKYLPLGALKNRSLTLRLTLEAAARCMFNVTGDRAPDYTISDVAFVADVITMAETYNQKFMDMVRSVGSVSIHYQTYKNYQDSIANAATSANLLIPDSSRSLKSVFTVFNRTATTNQGDSLMLCNPAVQNYQYNILSETYPQSNVSINHAAGSTDRNQAFANLHIALGQLGSITSRTCGSADAYVALGSDANTDARSTTFAIGVCCEAHNKSSNLLESGINLQNSSQPIRCSITTMSSADAKTAFSFTLSDRLLEIDRDGNLRSSG